MCSHECASYVKDEGHDPYKPNSLLKEDVVEAARPKSRNCHSYEAMDWHAQSLVAQHDMQKAMKKGKTCIDGHKGVAHNTLPKGYETDSIVHEDDLGKLTFILNRLTKTVTYHVISSRRSQRRKRK